MRLLEVPPRSPLWQHAAPVLRELRTMRSLEELERIGSDGAHQGLRFLGAFGDDDECLGVAGWRIVINTSAANKLYVDDLVTTASQRSTGVGRALLDELKTIGRAAGCSSIELDSGVTRYRAHRFYLREGFDIVAHHFSAAL